MAFVITPDVPPAEGEGANFGLTLQFESNDTPLGAADATTLNFGAGVNAARVGDQINVTVPATGTALQFESSDTPLGSPDADTLNFGDGLAATRVGDQINVTVPTTSDAEIISGLVFDGSTDNAAAIAATIGPAGSFVTGNKTRAKPAQGGVVLSNSLNDIHPSVGLFPDSRGGVLFSPGNNLPGVTSRIAGQNPPSAIGDGSGAPAAFLRIVRDTADVSTSLAWAFQVRGWTLDARQTTQTNFVSGIRIPNPNPVQNPFDPDPEFDGNKDYVAGTYIDMDIMNWPGHGVTIESNNGRLSVISARALNNGGNGWDIYGKDIVFTGHWAAGGNQGWGVYLDAGSGFYAGGGNVWSAPNNRSLTCGSVYFNGHSKFCLYASEVNDWIRLDGSSGYRSAGVLMGNNFHMHGVNFVSDGVARDVGASGSARLQANASASAYQGLAFFANTNVRSDGGIGDNGKFTVNTTTDRILDTKHGRSNGDILYILSSAGNVAANLPAPLKAWTQYFVINKTTDDFQLSATLGGSAINLTTTGTGTLTWTDFPTPGNFGGDLAGDEGTACQAVYDFTQSAPHDGMTTVFEPLCSAPGVKGWTPLMKTYTVSGDTFTCTGHGLQINHRVGLYTTDTPPGGLTVDTVMYFVAAIPNANTFKLSAVPDSDPAFAVITTSSGGTGTQMFVSLSTPPFTQNHGNSLLYGYGDSYRCLWRLGAGSTNLTDGFGRGTHAHIALGINENDDANPNYHVEIGDRSAGRNAAYGSMEFDSVVAYRDNALSFTTTADGGFKNVQSSEAIHIFSTSGGGTPTFTVFLPVDNLASYEWEMQFIGGAITTLNWGVWSVISGTAGSINTNTISLPTSSPGAMVVRGFYRHGTNAHQITSITAGIAGMPMGRVTGPAVETGVVGERQRTFASLGSAVSLPTGTPTVATSITLQPGLWRIWASPIFSVISGTVQPTEMQWALNVSTAGAAFPATKDEAYGGRQMASFTAVAIFASEKCFTDVILTAATTYNLVQECTYAGGGSVGCSGSIVAMRRG